MFKKFFSISFSNANDKIPSFWKKEFIEFFNDVKSVKKSFVLKEAFVKICKNLSFIGQLERSISHYIEAIIQSKNS